MAARRGGRRPVRDRGRLVRPAQADAPARRHGRGAGLREDARRPVRFGAGAEPEGRRARARRRCRPHAAAAVGEPRAQPGEPAQDAGRGRRRARPHPRRARCVRPQDADRRRRRHRVRMHDPGRGEGVGSAAPDAGPAGRRRRPREPGRHRGLRRSLRREQAVRAGAEARRRPLLLRPLPRHARLGAGQLLRGAAARRHPLRRVARRHRRLPPRPGRERQHVHRGPRLHAGLHGRRCRRRLGRACWRCGRRSPAGWRASRPTGRCGAPACPRPSPLLRTDHAPKDIA